MTNTQLYFTLVKQFMLTFNQTCYRMTEKVPVKTLHLRGNLIEEEHEEYSLALKSNNKLDMLDGLCDLAYVVAGTLAVCGLTPIPYSSTKKDIKEWSIGPIADDVIEECFKVMPCHRRMYKYANELLMRVDDVGAKLQLPEAFKVVHENNMAKLWDTKPNDAALVSVYKGNNKWLVMRKADGKVMKPAGFAKPDLSKFI